MANINRSMQWAFGHLLQFPVIFISLKYVTIVFNEVF